MEVILNVNEILVATYIGSRRNAEARYKNRSPRFPEKVPGELWGYHIEAAHAELAVCKYLGIYWGFGVNTFHVADVSNTQIEIRWSQRNDLKIRPDDKGIIISVSGLSPKYKINGWIKAEAGKKDIYKYDKDPVCYFVPHKDLNSISTLNRQDYI